MKSIIENTEDIVNNITNVNALMIQAYQEYSIGRVDKQNMLKALQLYQSAADIFLKEFDVSFDACKEYFCTFENDTFNRPKIELDSEHLDMVEKTYSALNNQN